MKILEFLQENRISFYKVAQLQGKNGNHNAGYIQKKLEGKISMKMSEFESLCQALETYLKKPVKPEMFDTKPESVLFL